ncbi:MAG TPA: RNA polymerase sigma-70 factor [Puia sp.]|jgi:RNA polymerase sigma-70 factor (ECF subfamily)|nr:RNA polymerase sigma-70 factor [Puia sp.]
MRATSTLTDQHLLAFLRDGQEEAFNEIYRRYWEKLLAVGYHYTNNKQFAEEIVHDVFLRLWMQKGAVEITSLPAYLGTAVKFSVFKALLKEKRRSQIRAHLPQVEIVSSDNEQIEARFLQDYFQGIIETLPEKCRIVFQYSREESLSLAEISARMNISQKTVESHMTKALKTLRHGLAKLQSLMTILP